MIFILLLFTHMKMKKMLIGAFLGIFAVAGIAVLPNYASAQGSGGAGFNKVSDDSGFWWWDSQTTDYNPNVRWAGKFQSDSLIKTIRSAINWVLGILSFVALALCLWWGFQMMTSGGDSKKYEAGLNLLKWAAIGLAVIAASWLIVSLVFYVINGSLKGGDQGEVTGNSGTEQQHANNS